MNNYITTFKDLDEFLHDYGLSEYYISSDLAYVHISVSNVFFSKNKLYKRLREVVPVTIEVIIERDNNLLKFYLYIKTNCSYIWKLIKNER